jgi:hypothetical protein
VTSRLSDILHADRPDDLIPDPAHALHDGVLYLPPPAIAAAMRTCFVAGETQWRAR